MKNNNRLQQLYKQRAHSFLFLENVCSNIPFVQGMIFIMFRPWRMYVGTYLLLFSSSPPNLLSREECVPWATVASRNGKREHSNKLKRNKCFHKNVGRISTDKFSDRSLKEEEEQA